MTADLQIETIGFLGLGTMGRPMARHLIEAGHPVMVFNRTQSRGEEVIALGARSADGPLQLVESCRLVVSCLAGSDAVLEIYAGDDGLLRSAVAGQVFVEHGTISPDLARRLSRQALSVGAHFIDAPVSGGPDGAVAGTLVAMAGGDAEAIADAAVPLSSYCSSVIRVGESGAGVGLKLVNQLLAAVHCAAAGEAVALAAGLGIESTAARDVLGRSWGASAMLERKLDLAVAGHLSGTGAPITAFLPTLIEVLAEVDQLGLRSPVFRKVLQQFEVADRSGFGELDITALPTD